MALGQVRTVGMGRDHYLGTTRMQPTRPETRTEGAISREGKYNCTMVQQSSQDKDLGIVMASLGALKLIQSMLVCRTRILRTRSNLACSA